MVKVRIPPVGHSGGQTLVKGGQTLVKTGTLLESGAPAPWDFLRGLYGLAEGTL